MILATHGIVGSSIVQFTGLLDDYSGAAAAYSLRLLRSGYTGSAIKVRRSVGSPSEKDIGFVNNELDTSTLTTFCSGTDGFVTTWYDQSGNGYDATQTTAAEQPKIVSSGSVILENGKPTINYSSTTVLNTTYLGGSMTSFITVLNPGTIVNARIFTFSDNLSGFRLKLDTNLAVRGTSDINVIASGQTLGQILMESYGVDPTNAYVDSVFQISGNQGQYLNQNLNIGSSSTPPNNSFSGSFQELVFYNSDQSSNRTGIETNINDFYSIY